MKKKKIVVTFRNPFYQALYKEIEVKKESFSEILEKVQIKECIKEGVKNLLPFWGHEIAVRGAVILD